MESRERRDAGRYTYQVVEGWGQLPEGWQLVDVANVGVDSHDNVYACTRGTHPIVIFNPAGQVIGHFGDGQFVRPHGFCVGPDDAIYVADDSGQTVKKFSADGQLLMTLGTPGQPADTSAPASSTTRRPGSRPGCGPGLAPFSGARSGGFPARPW